jgi:hypothetical protein
MMGSKPRPLRLVQESNKDDERARKQANRGSWFGWMKDVNVKNLTEAGQRVVQGSGAGAAGTTPPTSGMERFMPAKTYSGDGQ